MLLDLALVLHLPVGPLLGNVLLLSNVGRIEGAHSLRGVKVHDGEGAPAFPTRRKLLVEGLEIAPNVLDHHQGVGCGEVGLAAPGLLGASLLGQ